MAWLISDKKLKKPDTVILPQTVDLGKYTNTNIHIFTHTYTAP